MKSFVHLAFLILFFFPTNARPWEQKSNRILVIHSYPPNSWTTDIDTGLTKCFKLQPNLSTQTYHYHSAFWSQQAVEKREGELKKILDLVKSTRPSVVVLVDDEATDALIESISKLSVPIVFTGINTLKEKVAWRNLITDKLVTGVWEAYPVERALQIMGNSLPGKNNFSILTSDTVTSDRTIELFDKAGAEGFMASHGFKLRKTYKLSYWGQWQEALREIGSKDDFFWVLIPFGVKDQDNQDVSTSRMIEWIQKNVKVPGVGARSLATGLFLSVGISAVGMGEETGKMVLKILESKNIKDVPAKDSDAYELVIRNASIKRINSKSKPRPH